MVVVASSWPAAVAKYDENYWNPYYYFPVACDADKTQLDQWRLLKIKPSYESIALLSDTQDATAKPNRQKLKWKYKCELKKVEINSLFSLTNSS